MGRPFKSVTHCAHCGERVLTQRAVAVLGVMGSVPMTIYEIQAKTGLEPRNVRKVLTEFDILFSNGPMSGAHTGHAMKTWRLSMFGREAVARLSEQRSAAE